eukprot:8306712-Pyramimonas_sp.AAC.1
MAVPTYTITPCIGSSLAGQFSITDHKLTWGCLLEISQTDDHRVLRAVQSLCPEGSFRFGTRSAQDERYAKRVDHAFRLIARIRCLQTATRARHDSESIEEVAAE